jgi:hypothetical protein
MHCGKRRAPICGANTAAFNIRHSRPMIAYLSLNRALQRNLCS